MIQIEPTNINVTCSMKLFFLYGVQRALKSQGEREKERTRLGKQAAIL